jgi:hypothetical protein
VPKTLNFLLVNLVVIRKSSYYVFVPGHVRVFLSGKGPTTVLFKSSLGTIVVHSSFNNNF